MWWKSSLSTTRSWPKGLTHPNRLSFGGKYTQIMNKTTKIVVVAVTVWIIVYVIVYLAFILTGDDTSLAKKAVTEKLAGFKGSLYSIN